MIRALFAALALVTCSASSPTTPAERMRQSTVQVFARIEGTRNGVKVATGWAGSGVVYSKTDGSLGPVTSRILSANHVLQAPHVGDVLESDDGPVTITAVTFTVHTSDDRYCSLKPLVLGDSELGDAATAEVDCDAGRVARLAKSVPPAGAEVFVVGHPLAFPLSLVTHGYVSGWLGGFLVISAPAAPGNSGGPVFYRGEVVGLLVRGSRDYSEISLAASLEVLQRRVLETGP